MDNELTIPLGSWYEGNNHKLHQTYYQADQDIIVRMVGEGRELVYNHIDGKRRLYEISTSQNYNEDVFWKKCVTVDT